MLDNGWVGFQRRRFPLGSEVIWSRHLLEEWVVSSRLSYLEGPWKPCQMPFLVGPQSEELTMAEVPGAPARNGGKTNKERQWSPRASLCFPSLRTPKTAATQSHEYSPLLNRLSWLQEPGTWFSTGVTCHSEETGRQRQ